LGVPSFRTRVRAHLLRTFKGRTREEAGWEDESTWVSSPPATFSVGRLEIAVSPRGVKAAGGNPPSAVYEVRVAMAGDPRSWTSKYGLPATDNSARQAGEIALADIDEAWREPDAWKARALAGMTAEEIEAMVDSPAMRLDLESARWIGPELDAVRPQTRARNGSWLSA
jgi:hypothetical protein